MKVKRYPSLRHIEAGVVGVSLDGEAGAAHRVCGPGKQPALPPKWEVPAPACTWAPSPHLPRSNLPGAEFVLCLNRALELDERHQVMRVAGAWRA